MNLKSIIFQNTSSVNNIKLFFWRPFLIELNSSLIGEIMHIFSAVFKDWKHSRIVFSDK